MEANHFLFNRRSRKHYPLVALAISALFTFLLCYFFVPKWETNDDVGMSMIAHGYGISDIGSPNILFSNVLWGYFVRLIPEINGVLGYSIATLSMLVICGAVIIYCLFQSGVHYLACLLVLALLLIRPVLFPQFTIGSGLLLVAAVVCWHLYAKENCKLTLGLGCLLAFSSYLVRDVEFLMVLVVAVPLLPSYQMLKHRTVQIAVLTLTIAIAISAAFDHSAYQRPEWKSYNELNAARAPFTDYGAGNLLKQHPEILARHGYSFNDIDLIGGWFFVDPSIANPLALKSMLTELGPLPTQANALTNAWSGLAALWSAPLVVSWLTALTLAIVRPSWKVAMSWALFIALVFLLGLMGRPGIIRLYVPMVSLLLVAPFLVGSTNGWRTRLATGVILVAAVINSMHLFSESRELEIVAENARKALSDFPHSAVVIWGASFPYIAVYPVLGASSSAMTYRHYGMGTSTHAPITLAYTGLIVGEKFKTLLTEGKGIAIMAYPTYFDMLEIYCREHLHGRLTELAKTKLGIGPLGAYEISQRRCM